MNAPATSPISLDYSFRLLPGNHSQGELFRSVMQNSPIPLSVAFSDSSIERDFRFRARALGNLMAAELWELPKPNVMAAVNMNRTRSDLARASQGGLHVGVLLSGQNQYSHAGHEYLMQGGTYSFASNESPLSGTFANSRSICVNLPSHWDRIGNVRLLDVLGHGFNMRRNHQSGLSAYLKKLMSLPDDLDVAKFEDEFFDVLALELNPRAASEHGKGLLATVRLYIDLNYCDPNLSPIEVAKLFEISTSYLHRIFSNCDTTFVSYVTARRLRRAKDLLLDTNFSKRPILEIAFDCGFRDINHFGRRFKEMYGCTPKDMRALAAPLELVSTRPFGGTGDGIPDRDESSAA